MVNNNTHGSITEDTKKQYTKSCGYELRDDELEQVSGAGEIEVKDSGNTPQIIMYESQEDKMNERLKGKSDGEGFLMNHMIDVNNLERTVF